MDFNNNRLLDINGGIFKFKGGNGELELQNGSIFKGKWKWDSKGVFEGKGTLTLFNGISFEGNWKKGKREGKGTLYYKDGSVWVNGHWVQNTLSTVIFSKSII